MASGIPRRFYAFSSGVNQLPDPCFECGQPADHDHHVVPLSRGGTKTVPLCGECHGKAHHRDKAMSTGLLAKEGIARAKARGVKFGTPENMTPEAQARGARTNHDDAIVAYAIITPTIEKLRDQGLTLQDIADNLNTRGEPTRTGSDWSPVQVMRVLRRSSAI